MVTGDLGAAYMGLQILEREKEVYKANPNIQPDLDGYDYLLERQLKPEARKDIIGFLKDLEVKPTSMIDISDDSLLKFFICVSKVMSDVISTMKKFLSTQKFLPLQSTSILVQRHVP